MQTLKDISIEVIKNLPASSTMEEIMYKLNLTAQVVEGLQNKEEGKVLSTNELLQELKKWEKK